MKKFAKMSLVAAVAVAGLNSTASATDLSEAIKGVDISGQFRLRYEDSATETSGVANSTNSNKSDVEVEITAKVPVNDNVTAVFKIDNANDDTQAVGKGAVNIEDYYFSYVNGAATVNFGQQNIPGRLTDASQGDGVVALYNAGAFTVGAAGFITQSASDTSAGAGSYDGNDLYSVLAMGSVGPVALSAQYADVVDLGDSYNITADATVGPVKVGVEYSETDLDGNSNEYETFKAYVSGSFGPLSAKLSYGKTGDQGSGSYHAVASGNYAASAETPAEFLLWQTGSATKAKFDVVALDASYAVSDKLSVRAAYANGEYYDATEAVMTDISEVLGQVSYKMSSNLNAYFRISQYEKDFKDTSPDTDKTRGRIEVAYTF
jgi:hypothetical protein